MSGPRWLHRAFAAVAGYGWFPCPLCDEPFGGHEATGASIPKPGHPGVGRLICPRCDAERLGVSHVDR